MSRTDRPAAPSDARPEAASDARIDSSVQPTDAPPAEERVCSPNGIATTCDPIAGTGCKAGSCYPAKGGFACVCPAGTAASGEPCGTSKECLPGRVCVGATAPGVCRPVCDPGASTCPASSDCTAITGYGGKLGYCDPAPVDAGP